MKSIEDEQARTGPAGTAAVKTEKPHPQTEVE